MRSKKYTIEELKFVEKPTHGNFKNLEGQQFNKLTILGYAGKFGNTITKRHYWWCQCNCPEKSIIKITSTDIISNHTTSCGCFHSEITKKRNFVHGDSNSIEYNTFYLIKDRCENSNNDEYHNYGGRGIKCLFESYLEFLVAIGRRPENCTSIDRIDVNGHYEITNVRWSYAQEQNRNRRNNRLITIGHERKCMAEWGDVYNIDSDTIERRINKYNWCDYCAVTIPPNRGRGKNAVTCIHKTLKHDE